MPNFASKAFQAISPFSIIPSSIPGTSCASNFGRHVCCLGGVAGHPGEEAGLGQQLGEAEYERGRQTIAQGESVIAHMPYGAVQHALLTPGFACHAPAAG